MTDFVEYLPDEADVVELVQLGPLTGAMVEAARLVSQSLALLAGVEVEELDVLGDLEDIERALEEAQRSLFTAIGREVVQAPAA